MNWTEFHNRYIVEANIVGTVDLTFEFNTPIYAAGKPSIRQVNEVRVLDKNTFQIVKEYKFEMGAIDIRSTKSVLKAFIMRDFQIDEMSFGWRDAIPTPTNPMPEPKSVPSKVKAG